MAWAFGELKCHKFMSTLTPILIQFFSKLVCIWVLSALQAEFFLSKVTFRLALKVYIIYSSYVFLRLENCESISLQTLWHGLTSRRSWKARAAWTLQESYSFWFMKTTNNRPSVSAQNAQNKCITFTARMSNSNSSTDPFAYDRFLNCPAWYGNKYLANLSNGRYIKLKVKFTSLCAHLLR